MIEDTHRDRTSTPTGFTRSLRWLTWTILLLGCVLRLCVFLQNTPLLRDEAALALNILERSPAQLLRALDYKQAAPPGFLVLVKLVTSVLGDSEYALRSVALIAGMSSVWLFYRVALASLRPWGVAISSALFAFSLPLIEYSAQTKQYSLDVAVALLLIAAAGRVRHDGGAWKPRGALGIGLLGAASIWFSHPAVFVLAAVAVTWIGRAVWRREWHFTLGFIPVGLMWGASFAVVSVTSLRYTVFDEFLVQFWSGVGPGAPRGGAFLPLPPQSPADLMWTARAMRAALRALVPMPHVWLAAIAWILGVVVLGARGNRRIDAWFVVLLLTLAASALQLYPFAPRLLLFAAPAFLIPVGVGLESAAALLRTRVAHALGGSLALLAVLYPMFPAAAVILSPRPTWELRAALGTYVERRAPGDLLFVYYGTKLPLRYYAPRFGLNAEEYVLGVSARDDWSGYERDLEALGGRKRLWILFSQFLPEEHAFMRRILERTRVRRDSFRFGKAELDLYVERE